MHLKHEARFAQLTRDRQTFRGRRQVGECSFEIYFRAGTTEARNAGRGNFSQDAIARPACRQTFETNKGVVFVERVEYLRGWRRTTQEWQLRELFVKDLG